MMESEGNNLGGRLKALSECSHHHLMGILGTQNGAENICKQLGYTGGTRYTAGGGTGPINAGNRRCIGGEKTIFDCPLFVKRTDITGCKHKHDQGVNCTRGGEKKN